MLLCTPSDLSDYLLQGYLDACEEQNPGLAERTIAAVSGEVSDLLAYRYPQPWPHVPPVIRYIASVISAYRTAEAITTLVTSEGATENEWIPLQKEWKRATGILDEIASGKRKIPLDEVVEDREDASVAVVSPHTLFDLRGF